MLTLHELRELEKEARIQRDLRLIRESIDEFVIKLHATGYPVEKIIQRYNELLQK